MTERHAHPNEMTNSHILVQAFDYLEPASVAEAVSLLAKYGEQAEIMAGGTNVLVSMKTERDAPAVLIQIGQIPGLEEIRLDPVDGSLIIGPRATIWDVMKHSAVQELYPALAEACAAFGSTQIQAMGTLGGNICNGSPASDTVPALLVYDAQLLLVGPNGERRLPLDEFFLGPGLTARAPTELLTAIILPPPPQEATSLNVKISRVTADLAKANLAVMLVRSGSKIVDCRLAMGSVAPTPLRLRQVEQMLVGKKYHPDWVEKAGDMASDAISPIDDIRSTAWYRRQIAWVMVYDTLTHLWQRPIEAPQAPAAQPSHNGHTAPREPVSLSQGVRQEVELHVNGKPVKVWVAANELLLNVLRERLELTGAKYGCGIGECGACTVEIDGKPALSCLTLAVSARGKEITTVEGLLRDSALDPLQEAFIEHGAFQCGYCTPGFLMSTRSLLAELPKPTEEQVRDFLKGNRCRCTGYTSIVRAILKHTS